MVITTIAGNSGYSLIFSDAVTGGANAETPDGNVIYLFPEPGFKIGMKNTNRRRPTREGASQYPGGKRDFGASGNCLVHKEGANTATTELGAILDFIQDHSISTTATKAYMFIKHIADNEYPENLSPGHQYMVGYFQNADIAIPEGKEYRITIKFDEVTRP